MARPTLAGEDSSVIKPAGRDCEVYHDSGVFSELRAYAQIPDDFVNTGWTFDSFAAGGGKGGTLMAYVDDTYIVKELSEDDHKTLLSLATSYGQHVRGGDTVLCPVYLHFKDKVSHRKFFVMRNCVGTGPFTALYDLKGCADDKTLEKDGNGVKAVHKRCWDVSMWCRSNWSSDRREYYKGKQDAKSCSIAVTVDQRKAVMNSIKRDTDWLARNQLMDYSLLVGVKSMPEVVLASGGSGPSSGPRPMARRDPSGGSVVVYVSIIDFLQKWTTGKMVARGVKVFECDKATVPPGAYGRRFCRRLERRFQATEFDTTAPDLPLKAVAPAAGGIVKAAGDDDDAPKPEERVQSRPPPQEPAADEATSGDAVATTCETIRSVARTGSVGTEEHQEQPHSTVPAHVTQRVADI